jgi:alpha-glucosidase
MGPLVQHLSGYRPEQLTLLVYPAGQSSFTLYEDDGETNAYRRGHFAMTIFECLQSEAAIVCRVGAPEGDASLVPERRTYSFQINCPTPPRMARAADGSRLDWQHDGRFVHVQVGGRPTEVSLEW